MENMKYYIGIDPGANGGIVVLDQTGFIRFKSIIPKVKATSQVDIKELNALLVHLKIYGDYQHVGIEDVHAIFGTSAKSNFSFGRICGRLEMGIVANEFSHTFIQPKEWQREVWTNTDLVTINTGKRTPKGNIRYKTDTKATSLICAKRLFPTEDFLASTRSRKPHDGIIDASLIAEYCRRKNF